MIRKKWFTLLLTALLLSVMTYTVPVWAEEGGNCENPEAECEIICQDSECEDIFDDQNGIYIYADGENKTTTLEYSIDSENIGAELTALNSGTITLNATNDEGSADIYGTESGVYIDAQGGSKVTANTAGIASDGSGLEVKAETGTIVDVINEGMIGGYNAFLAANNGGKVTLKTDDIQGVVGVGIFSGAGETTVTSNAIAIEEYGVIVDVYKEEGDAGAPKVTVTVNGDITDDLAIEVDPDSGFDVEPDPEDPEDAVLKAADTDEGDPYSEAWWNDAAEGTEDTSSAVEGTDETGDDLPEGGTASDPGEDLWNENWQDEDPSEADSTSESVNSTGVIINADGEGSEVTVAVSGKVSAEYGNEIEAFGASKAIVTVSGDVETDYGNRISAEDSGTKAVFDFGGNVNAGGVAIDTHTNSAELEVSVAKDIIAEDSKDEGDDETIGIYSNSEGSGTTAIDVTKGIKVSSQQQDYIAYGIETANIGGTLTITVGENVDVKGSSAVGISITNDPDLNLFGEDEEDEQQTEPKAAAESTSTPPETTVTVNGNTTASGNQDSTGIESWNSNGKTNIEVNGDVSGSATGMDINAFGEDKNASFTDILVTGTVSGKDAGLLVNDEADNDGTDNDNLNLTVWAVDLKSKSKLAAQNEDGTENKTVAENIKYIIKIDPESEGKIAAVKEDGSELETSHDLPVAKLGETVIVRSADGSKLTGVTNGKNNKTALPQNANGDYYLTVPSGGAVWLAIGTSQQPATPPNSIDFYTIGDLTLLFDRELPRTGFSANHVTPLAARPQGLVYGSTGLTLQIPGLDVAEEILTVPETDDSYPVEWLGSAVGLLEGSSLPGKGISVLTGHNHLNTTEAGPFLFLGKLETGDLLMVNDRHDRMQMYKVYDNSKIAADGFASVADKLRENALVLITCEDESVNGGYLSRRVILAEPL